MLCFAHALRWLLLCLPALAAAAPAHAASFECRRPANGAERMICADRELSQLDERLALAYKHFMSASSRPYEDQGEHLDWLAERNRCKDAGCIRALYAERLARLRSEAGAWLAYRASDQEWVAAASGEPACQAARAQLEALGGTDFAARGPEQGAGVLCGAPGRDCPAARAVPLDDLARAGAALDAPAIGDLLAAPDPIAVSRVDLDNNGVQDLRLTQRSGQDQCERSMVLLGGAGGRFQLTAERGYELLSRDGLLCGRERLAIFRHHEVNYVAALGEQRVTLLRGTPKDGLQPVCGFKRRWTEQEKRAAYAVLKRHPDLLRDARILRPEKDKAPDGRRVWAVQVRCATGSLRASFQVDPRTLRPQTLVAPGSTARCDSPRMAEPHGVPPYAPAPQALAWRAQLSAGPWLDWEGLP